MRSFTRVNKLGRPVVFGGDDKQTRVTCNGKSIVVPVGIEDMSQRWFNWQIGGELIQAAFGNLDPGQREFLMTGITETEFDEMWEEVRMTGRWVTPVDPDCPVVVNFHDTVMDDPMTRESGCGSEIMEDFERRHRAKCSRCQEYGAANVDVEYN